MFKIALIISTTIHIGCFGLLWPANHPFLKNGYGYTKDNIIVFEIGWVEAKKVPEEKGTGTFLLKQKGACPLTGSSGRAKKNLGGKEDKYLLEVRRRIEQFKFYPREARRRLIKGSVTVGFYIDSNGNPKDIFIIKSSGYSTLDNATKETILKASPFPKPADKKYVQTTIVFTLYSDNLS